MFENLKAAHLPSFVLEKARKEIAWARRYSIQSANPFDIREYCEWLAALPWTSMTTECCDFHHVASVLDEELFGLQDAKDRILGQLALGYFMKPGAWPVLCIVGAPGTGKTTLSRCVARCLGRTFARIDLGGLRSEAEIRGIPHDSMDAMPGRITEAVRRAGSLNPVILLDDIDALSPETRSLLTPAFLGLFDPEQNAVFVDRYLGLPLDLSNVLFIMTATSSKVIPQAMLERVELIEIPGYSDQEKLMIAKRHILPRMYGSSGPGVPGISFSESALLSLIRDYTLEPGVRDLERLLGSILRKIARRAVEDGKVPTTADKQDKDTLECGSQALPGCVPASPLKVPEGIRVTVRSLGSLLGKAPRHSYRPASNLPGLAQALAWTGSGGRLLAVETVIYEGGERLVLTGNLGAVMKESAMTALGRIRAYPPLPLPRADVFRRVTVHIHVAEGATPKDGPSAGLAMAASILSAAARIPLPADLAMTGEITLAGGILAVGGIREKYLAAARNGIRRVLIPEGNRAQVEALSADLRRGVDTQFVKTLEEAVGILFPADVQPEQHGLIRPSGEESVSREDLSSHRVHPGNRRRKAKAGREDPAAGEADSSLDRERPPL